METTTPITQLGPIQKAWVDSLRKHPERQTHSVLGEGTKDDYKACCLGEAIMVLCNAKGIEPIFKEGKLFDTDGTSSHYPEASWKELGLRSDIGILKTPYAVEGKKNLSYRNLTFMNDSDFTWAEIADYIEANPDNVFTVSV